MAFNHRKMFMPSRSKGGFTFFISCCQILSPPPPPPEYDYLDDVGKKRGDTSLIVTILICLVGGVLLLQFLVVFIYYAIKRSRRNPATVSGETTGREEDEEGEERDFSDEETVDHHVWHITTVGLQRSVIESITVFRFRKLEGLTDGAECSVCLNEFQEDESLRLLPKCSHAFHINCIDTWLISHKNCPLCRAPILLNENSPESLVIETNSNDSGSSGEFSEPRREEFTTTATSEAGDGSESSKDQFRGSGSRNPNFPSRAFSDLADNRKQNLEPIRRSFSIGSSFRKACDTTTRPFYFSAKFFSSRSSRIQDPVRGSDPGTSGSC